MENKHRTLIEALADPTAGILVHGAVSCDPSGNSRARQKALTIKGEKLYEDPLERSYWYLNENERLAFERRGGLVLGT